MWLGTFFFPDSPYHFFHLFYFKLFIYFTYQPHFSSLPSSSPPPTLQPPIYSSENLWSPMGSQQSLTHQVEAGPVPPPPASKMNKASHYRKWVQKAAIVPGIGPGPFLLLSTHLLLKSEVVIVHYLFPLLVCHPNHYCSRNIGVGRVLL